jgi:type VI secretion system secreted protein Hcp
MSTNVFVRIGDIKGGSHDSRHQDEIEVVSWSWGLTNPAAGAAGGGGSGGRAAFQDVAFVHLVDRASPRLMLACASAQRFPEARLTVRRPDAATSDDFLRIILQDVRVTGVHTSPTEAVGGLVEQVTIAFTRVDYEYRHQLSDGSLDTAVQFKWDLQQNRPF